MNRMLLFAALFGILFLSGCTLLGEECGSDRAYVCGEDNFTYTNACYARQEGVRVAHEGACEINLSARCADSDNGNNALEAGAVGFGSQQYNDSCAGATSVYEYYCADNAVQSETVLCPAGTECRAGECAAYGCSDTDGGRAQDVLGTAIKGPENRTDECVGMDSVLEYYCLANDIADIELSCGSGKGCLNGACAQLACMDSDGGYNIYMKGTVREGQNVYADYCAGTSNVKEYYCSGDHAVPVTVGCGQDFYCSEGACLEYMCRDSDGGRDEGEYGETTKGDSEYDDGCYDIDTVNEYYCSDNEIKGTRVDCGSDEVCDGGECVEQECADTDGGNDRHEYGVVTVDGGTHRDECVNSDDLEEYFCDGQDYDSAQVPCTFYGELCWENECSPADCEDSDGTDAGVYGTVRISTDNGYSYSESDACTDDGRSVRERYCSGLEVRTDTIDCASDEACSGGRCVEASCSDSDGGRNYIVGGSVTKGDVTQKDSCDQSDDKILYEYYCSGNEIAGPATYTCLTECTYNSDGEAYCIPL